MKKYLYSALALPLLFACSSEDFEKEAISNDQFAGIEKVDATFTMDEGPVTRMDIKDGEYTGWTLAEGDKYGFAWLTDDHFEDPAYVAKVAITGNAFQNHPLTQEDYIFKPATSIYVGKYFLYRPYDETVVSPAAINFKSLEEQPLAEGLSSKLPAWKSLAASAIIIGDKWTEVTPTGAADAKGKVWNKAGIGQSYDIYAAIFSNQTGLDLTYKKNNVGFGGKKITGATDIDYTYPADATVGAAKIYGATVQLTGAAKSFTYAPDAAGKEPVKVAGVAGEKHEGDFWADKKNVAAAYGFNFTAGAITLNVDDANGLSTATTDNKAWFWFNSLPVTAGDGAEATNVVTIFNTSYGDVTVTKSLKDCAYAFDQPHAGAVDGEANEWIKLGDAADDITKAKDKKNWKIASHNTFVNQYGNHKGKYTFDVDFSDGVMNGMDIKNDEHLQQALKYYIASEKDEDPVVLDLQPASATDNTFKISKISIALLQTINAGATSVKVNAAGLDKVIVTQDGQSDLGLANKKEVPNLDNVFSAATAVSLSKDCEWTWAGGDDAKTALTVDANVTSITNEGTLTVNATNVELSVAATTLANAAGAKMYIKKVTTVKNNLTNLGEIYVGSASDTTPELRAYGKVITNDATGLKDATKTEPAEYGIIYNYGVVGVSAGAAGGEFNNYGYIKMMSNAAITLLTSNQKTGNFAAAFKDDPDPANWNKMGVVELPNGNATALVSVSNATDQGFIKYDMTSETPTAITYATPAGNVKYNTIIVNGDITFNAAEDEIQYIEFAGTRTQVVNPADQAYLSQLKGIYVHEGKSIIIEKTNKLVCGQGAFLDKNATVYNGGTFTYVSTTNYFGTWSTDQIIKY